MQSFGVADLYTVPVWTDRAAVRAAGFDEQPITDPTKPEKTWAITMQSGDQPGDSLVLQVFDPAQGKLVPYTTTKGEAAVLNLPGEPFYPPWQPTSDAKLADGTIVAATNLLTADQATMLGGLLGGVVVTAGFPGTVYGPSGRKEYGIIVAGAFYNAGLLLALLYSQGGPTGPQEPPTVGRPGTINPATDTFTPTVLPTLCAPGVVPVPCRALVPGETFAEDRFSNWCVVNSNVATPYTVQSAGSGGGLTSAQAASLANIERLTILIADKFTII